MPGFPAFPYVSDPCTFIEFKLADAVYIKQFGRLMRQNGGHLDSPALGPINVMPYSCHDIVDKFQTDLGVYKAVNDNAAMAPASYNLAALAVKDRRDELSGNPAKNIEACIVTANYVFQVPINVVGNVNTGPMQGMQIPSPLCWQTNDPPWDTP